MVKIKIIFFSWDNIYSNLIQLKSGNKWSHIGLAFQQRNGNYLVYEAINKGLVKSTYSKEFIDTRVNIGEFIAIKELEVRTTKKEIIKVCESYLGSKYDWISIFNIGFYFLFGKYALNFKGARTLICSEFVARVLYEISNKKIDFEKEYNKDYDYIEPSDIWKSKYFKE